MKDRVGEYWREGRTWKMVAPGGIDTFYRMKDMKETARIMNITLKKKV